MLDFKDVFLAGLGQYVQLLKLFRYPIIRVEPRRLHLCHHIPTIIFDWIIVIESLDRSNFSLLDDFQ